MIAVCPSSQHLDQADDCCGPCFCQSRQPWGALGLPMPPCPATAKRNVAEGFVAHISFEAAYRIRCVCSVQKGTCTLYMLFRISMGFSLDAAIPATPTSSDETQMVRRAWPGKSLRLQSFDSSDASLTPHMDLPEATTSARHFPCPSSQVGAADGSHNISSSGSPFVRISITSRVPSELVRFAREDLAQHH
ncbi:hypothetical protein BDV95DRAFT_177119 [Massariosphaeria phaeospora]|uniref:Uncharacterized protein n=1 Tax=Massariosphaeria phaeospora TaxID=100035 RepID=A0A7C8I3X2_9PLEO|nr:hypothetical protein BDV95DRAFT_177119 [Massariosphaeria phaeospora]